MNNLIQDIRYGLKKPLAATRSHARRGVFTGAGHWREHRDLFSGQWRAAEIHCPIHSLNNW